VHGANSIFVALLHRCICFIAGISRAEREQGRASSPGGVLDASSRDRDGPSTGLVFEQPMLERAYLATAWRHKSRIR